MVAPAPAPAKRTAPVKPAEAKAGGGRLRRWAAAACVAVAMVGGIYLLGPRLGLWTSGNTPGPEEGTPSEHAGAVPSVRFDAALEQAILAMPEWRSPVKPGAKGTPAGKLELVEQTARSGGEHVLHVWADTQKPGLGGQPIDVRVLMEVRLDASGKPVQAREIGQKDADLVAFEKALDNAKM